MIAFSYLNPYLEKIFKPFERYQRMVVTMTLLYHCFIIFMLHQVRPYLCWGFPAEAWSRKIHLRFPRHKFEQTNNQADAHLRWPLRLDSRAHLGRHGPLLPSALVQLVPSFSSHKRRLYLALLERLRWVPRALIPAHSSSLQRVLVGSHPHGHHTFQHTRNFPRTCLEQEAWPQAIWLAWQKRQE